MQYKSYAAHRSKTLRNVLILL